jgi:FkbH-like protein
MTVIAPNHTSRTHSPSDHLPHAQDELASLADWSRRNLSPDLAHVQRFYGRATSLVARCGWTDTAQELARHESVAAKFLAASLFEASPDHESASAVLDSFSCPFSRPLEAFRLFLQARTLISMNLPEEAVVPLRRSITLTESYRALTAAGKLVKAQLKAGVVQSRRNCRLAMLGNATFDFILPVLETVAFASRIDLTTYNGAYNQQVQEVLDRSSGLHAFQPEVVVLAADWRSLGIPEQITDSDALLSSKLDEIVALWDSLSSNFHCQIIQHNYVIPEISAYGALSGRMANARGSVLRRLNLALLERAATRTNVTILDVDEIASLLGKRNWDDARMWIAAKQYPSANAIGLLAKHQIAVLRAIFGLSSKCLVLDLDNTLWGGIIGEERLEGIRLGGSPEGEAYVDFQHYVKTLKERGVILAICTKNEESDARSPFLEHPEMVLRLDDFSVFVANWLPKADNIRAIAKKLNIGMESLVFIDDNPAERDFVRRALPDVEVPEMPSDPSFYTETLHRELLFETLSITAEDARRTESYRASIERDRLQESAASLDEFLFSLQMQVDLRPFDSANLPRITQLINKTNQFNLTTVRMTVEQIRQFSQTPGNYTQFVHLRDRFGDSGITGVLMASPKGDALKIDQWLMSCRILGRKVEDLMLASVWNFARASGYRALMGTYSPTPKNQQVADLYDRAGFTLIGQAEAGVRTYRAELNDDQQIPGLFAVSDLTDAVDSFNVSGEIDG